MKDYKETTSFEIYGEDDQPLSLEFKCPICGDHIYWDEDKEGDVWIVTCLNCFNAIDVHLKLVLEW